MRPDRAVGHGLSTCHLGRRRALQAVLARFFRAPDRIGPETRIGNHPAHSRVARVYPPRYIDRCSDSHPAVPGRYRFKLPTAPISWSRASEHGGQG